MSDIEVIPANRRPPKKGKLTPQYELFCERAENSVEAKKHYSNTFKFADGIPKFFFTNQMVKGLRNEYGDAGPYTHKYSVKVKDKPNPVNYKIKIHPAQVEQDDGSHISCFPGVSEELVEEVLIKLLTNPSKGRHYPKTNDQPAKTYVAFTLSSIRSELKAVKKTRSLKQIKNSINILRGCRMEVFIDGEHSYDGNLLGEYYSVNRNTYLKDGHAVQVIQLPLYVSLGIEDQLYRRYNWVIYMQHKHQLTRWIHKRLIHNYHYATQHNMYHFSYDSIEVSGMLRNSRPSKNRAAVKASLKELKDCGVLADYRCDLTSEGSRGKVASVVYTLFSTKSFADDQKAANSLLNKSTSDFKYVN